jgi:Alginate export
MASLTQVMKSNARVAALSTFVLAVFNIVHADNSDPSSLAPPASSLKPPASAPSPPPHGELHYDEDYSYLKNPAASTDFFDPAKYFSLSHDPNAYMTFGGEARYRYEYFHNYLLGSGRQDSNGYNLLRVMLHADLHVSPYFRLFAEGISATEQGRDGGPRSTDENALDLYQAFADINIPVTSDTNLILRGGRQVIVFGAERLIGVSDFTNVRRNDDAVRLILTTPGNNLSLFYARPVQSLPYDLDYSVPATFFAGAYDTWQVPGVFAKVKTQLETYALYVSRPSITFNTVTSAESRYTFGSRVTLKPKPFDFDVEGDYQLGRFDEEETHAFSVAAIAGYTPQDVMLHPRLFLGGDIASGGSRTHPGDTFDQLFPSGHDKFGVIDALGRQNIIDVHPGVTLTLLENQPGVDKLTLLMQYRQFWRESDQDAIYTSGGTVLRTSNGSNAMSIGGEADIQLDWQMNRHVSAYVGYAHFLHGPFISDTGPANDIDFAYSAVTLDF